MKKLKQFFSHLDKQVLFYLTAFLFVFIPLYPKLPLAELIPGYLVRLRLEDIFVLVVGIVWFVQFLRKKIKWNTFFFWAIVGYLVIGIASILSGIFLNHTIPGEALHIGKSLLHFIRYAEYFSLFVVAFAGLRDQKDLNVIYKLLIVTIFAIAIYGIGQKYFQWPLYSTMNREYSKGQALVLGEGARVQSTFGGHYDLAAYMVMVLPIIFAYLLYNNSWPAKALMILVEVAGVSMLVLSGSKTALLAYALGHFVVLINYLRQKELKIKQFARYGIGIILTSLILIVAVFSLNKSMATTFLDLSLKIPVAGQIIGKVYEGNAVTDQPTDWIIDEPIYEEKKIRLDNGEEAIELVEKTEEWSANALKYGISMGIRLDELWPNAITGLRRNIYLGSSYANLNKKALNEFTDSDSTDNNFLRTLGETGLLGFVSFYAIIILLLHTFSKVGKKPLTPTFVFAQAFIGATIGLFFNAIYIDVFAASKIAFIYWLLAGLTLKSVWLHDNKLARQIDNTYRSVVKKFWNKRWPFILAALLMGLLLWRNPYLEEFTVLNKFNFKGDNYQNLVLAKCLANEYGFELCRPDTSLPVNFAPFYALLIAPIYRLMSNTNSYFFVNYALFTLTLIFLYGSLRKVIKSHFWQFTYLALFLLNPLIREWVMESTSINLLMTLASLALFLKIYMIDHFKRVYRALFSNNLALITIFVGLAFFTYSSFTHHPDPWFSDNSLNDKTVSYQTIKRANLTFSRQLKDKPYLITTINPYHFDLYGNFNYKLLPYTPHQDLFSDAVDVWGDFEFDYAKVSRPTDLHLLYEKIIANNPLYFTNAGVGDFKELRRNFSTKVIDLECGEQCNFYQLSPQAEIPNLVEPITYNDLSLANSLAALQENPDKRFSFVVLGHTYPDPDLKENQPLPGQPERYYAKQLSQRLAPIISDDSNFMVYIGDMVKRYESGRYNLFDRYFTTQYLRPIINVGQTPDPKRNMPGFEKYILGDNYFINFRGADRHTLSKAEKLAFYNSFYELEFSDKDYVFIFSYENLRYNSDFMELVMPKLNQLEDKSIYIVAGNGGEMEKYDTDINHILNERKTYSVSDYGNVFFVETGFNEETPATAIKFEIGNDGGMRLTPVELE